MDCEGAELSIVLVDDEAIAELNLAWRGIDVTTDVLAFPMDEPGEELHHEPLLGDVVISTERAAAQASEAGHSLEKEIDVLLIHGVLHLLGYDHTGSKKKAEAMAKKEAQLLKAMAKED